MKVIGLKPDNFEPITVFEKVKPKPRSTGLSPIQNSSESQLEGEDHKIANHEPAGLVIDFINRLKAKQKEKDQEKTNKSLLTRRQRAYLRVGFFKVLMSQKGAKLDKKF